MPNMYASLTPGVNFLICLTKFVGGCFTTAKRQLVGLFHIRMTLFVDSWRLTMIGLPS